jgi:alkylresorcinol/alkylpyrone synthase
MPRILHTASGFPPHFYSQETISAALQEIWAGYGVNTARVAKLHAATGVEGRHIAVPREEYYPLRGWEGPNAIFAEAAPALAEELIAKLFDETPLAATDIDLFAFASTTGLAIPTIDARLMNRLRFRSDTRRLPLFGLGCVAGAAGTARIADHLLGHPTHAALLICIELCSLTIQKHDTSVANLIACGLFGDGAGAVLMVGDEHPLAGAAGPAVVASRAVLFPDSEHYMGWEIRESGMQIVLSAEVPEAVETSLRQPVESFLAEHRLAITDIDRWVCHPGGPRVIEAVETALGLDEHALDASRAILRDVGNVSSASVLVILDRLLRDDPPPAGSTGLMMAMGPGFVAELVLLRW